MKFSSIHDKVAKQNPILREWVLSGYGQVLPSLLFIDIFLWYPIWFLFYGIWIFLYRFCKQNFKQKIDDIENSKLSYDKMQKNI